MRGGVVRTVTSSVAGVSTSFSSVSSVLGNILSVTTNTQDSQDRRHSGAEDFEFISQEDLDLDQDGFSRLSQFLTIFYWCPCDLVKIILPYQEPFRCIRNTLENYLHSLRSICCFLPYLVDQNYH